MTSIFDLKESASDLESLNQGTSKLTYEQVQPLRDVTGTNFPGGEQNYRFETQGTKWWIPARSYMRMKCTIQAAGGQPILQRDYVAPNMGIMANLFQSAELRIADKTVSRIDSYFSEVDAIEKRSNKSKAWLDSTGSMEWWQPNHFDRELEISTVTNSAVNPGIATGKSSYTKLHPGNQASTLVTADNDATVTGVNTLFVDNQELRVGDIIVFENDAKQVETRFTVTVVTDNTNVEVAPRPSSVIAATALWSRIRFEDGNDAPLKKDSFDVIWQPPLSIFKIQSGLPSMRVTLTLQPQDVNSYQKRAIESLYTDKAVGVGAGQFTFNVDECHLYIATVNGPRVDNMTYYLSLDETRCQPQNVNTGTGLQQKNYDVSPSAYGLSVAFADAAAGVDTRFSASKFKMRAKGAFSDGTMAVERLFVLYSGQNKPSPDGDWDFSGTNNTYEQAYAETMLYNGGYFDSGGSESFKDWLNRGHYHYYAWPRDGDDRSTRVAVNYKFSESPGTDASVLLFDHYKKILIIQVSDGRVVDIIEQDA